MTTSLDRLKAFRANWNDGERIDEDSGLTVADLDAVIDAAERIVAVPSLASMIEQGKA